MCPRFIVLGLSASLLLACQPNVFRTVVTGETTVRGGSIPGTLTAFPAIGSFTNLDFGQNQDFKKEGVSKSQVRSVAIEALQLKILSPDDEDFGFLDTLLFYARTADMEELIAEKQEIAGLSLPPPNPTLVLDVKDVELAPYVKAPQMSIVVRGKGRPPPGDVRLEAHVTFRVEVKLLP